MDNSNLAASIAIFNKNNVWVEDNMMSHCHNCGAEFSFLKRKHHCRNCGNIFCYKCANKSIIIPDFIIDRPDPADYWNISYYISSLKGSEERVCQKCYDLIQEKTKAYDAIVNIFDSPMPIDQIRTLSESKSDVKNHYFDHLRNIQYYLPNHKYSEIDKKLLSINAPYFSRHSKYLMHLIKSVEWADFDNEQVDFIFSILNGDQNKKCTELYCTRTCRERLSFDDCINILFSCVDHLPNNLLSYLFDLMAPTSEEVIICHLSFFINLIKSNIKNNHFRMLLFNLLNTSTKLIYHLYWFLNNEKEGCSVAELANINNFLDLFSPVVDIHRLHQEYTFYTGLINNLHEPQKYLMNNFEACKPISLPYNTDIKLLEVDLNNITIKESYTKPVIITFKTSAGIKRFLFKKESIMNDVIVLNLMILCDTILKESLKDNNFDTVIYPVMPLTKNSGMIEMIDKAETIHDICKKKNIMQHIFERNEEKKIGEVMNRYMYSLVSYTLHSYFIGLGDRHLQNIMISDDGAIFHIDFGFILGKDAHPISPSDIKLNTDMLDVIGGKNGNKYTIYLDLCSKGVRILRKYFNMFFILFYQIRNHRFTEKYIEKFIMSRFQPRQKDLVVVSELLDVIKKSHNAFSDLVRDFLHYHTQEKTVQHGVGKMFNNAIGTFKSLTGS